MRNWYWQLRPLSQFSMWRIAKWQSIFIYPQPALVSNNCPPPADRHADDKRKKRTVQCNNIIVKYHRLRKWKRWQSVPLEGATTTKIPYCSLRKTQPTDQLTVASSLSSSQDEADEAVKRRIIWGHLQPANSSSSTSLTVFLSFFLYSHSVKDGQSYYKWKLLSFKWFPFQIKSRKTPEKSFHFRVIDWWTLLSKDTTTHHLLQVFESNIDTHMFFFHTNSFFLFQFPR